MLPYTSVELACTNYSNNTTLSNLYYGLPH